MKLIRNSKIPISILPVSNPETNTTIHRRGASVLRINVHDYHHCLFYRSKKLSVAPIDDED